MKELRKLKRSELIEIIYQLRKNEQELQSEISLLKAQLQDKSLKFENVGSVAEAAICISEVFEEAQKAANMYLDEIKERNFAAKKEFDSVIDESHRESNRIISAAQKEAENIKTEARKDADAILQNALRQKAIVEKQCKLAREELEQSDVCVNGFEVQIDDSSKFNEG